MKETVNHPDHYKGNKYEAIDIIEDYNLNFNLGNVIKYTLRSGKKDDLLEDLRKAQFYIAREIQKHSTTDRRSKQFADILKQVERRDSIG